MDVVQTYRSTSQLMDHVAHEANIVRKDEQIAGDATAPVGREVQRQADAAIGMLPNVRGDMIRNGYDNDAVVAGLAKSLYGDGFGTAQANARPGMNPQAAKSFARCLDGPEDANTKMVLQERADKGFVAAEMAQKAVSYLPAEQQPAAAAKWLQDSYGSKMKDDVAFATGANYNGYLRATQGQDAVHAEMTAVGHRYAIQNPSIGLIAG